MKSYTCDRCDAPIPRDVYRVGFDRVENHKADSSRLWPRYDLCGACNSIVLDALFAVLDRKPVIIPGRPVTASQDVA